MKKCACILFACILLCLSCEKIYEHKTYYKTIGEGYVFDVTDSANIKPIKGATITVRSSFYLSDNLLGKSPVEENFYSDENGYYQIQFIKQTYDDGFIHDVKHYSFRVKLPQSSYFLSNYLPLSLPIEDIKDKEIFTLDSLKAHFFS